MFIIDFCFHIFTGKLKWTKMYFVLFILPMETKGAEACFSLEGEGG